MDKCVLIAGAITLIVTGMAVNDATCVSGGLVLLVIGIAVVVKK